MKSTLRSIKEPGTSSPTAKWFTCTPNTQRPTAAHYEGLDYVTHTGGVECPPGPACQFVPALYQQFSDDPSDYGNYDLANRPADGLKIRYIIHDTESSYESALGTFTTPSYVSAHYLIRPSDGFVTQLVRTKDVTWQAANFVYLHTAPSFDAPLISDPALHPDGSPGTALAYDWGATRQ